MSGAREQCNDMMGSYARMFADRWTSSLSLRVLLLTLFAFICVAVPAGFGFVRIVETTIVKLGTLFAEKQILYDRYRGLEALNREVALAETLARSPVIIDWAGNEYDPEKLPRGIAELEHFRDAFADQSYFFVVHASGNYYFNDSEGSYLGDQRRYTLDPDNAADGWYYKTVEAGPGCHLNVNNDANLQVTKVWINCVVSQNGEALGVLGTGIDLTVFIRDVVESDQVGVESMFVDSFGAVQANRNESLIDFHSLTKDMHDKKTFFQMIDTEGDRREFEAMLAGVRQTGINATARFLHVDGTRLLVGVGYLERLGWYNVTLMDVDQIIDRRLFAPIGVLIVVMMLAAAALVSLLFKRHVLDRLLRAEASVRRMEAGDLSARVEDRHSDEISRLAGALNRMANAVGTDRATLEAAVSERTQQLERIAYLDPLTGILNRRGVVEAFDQGRARAAAGQSDQAKGHRTGLLILDIDQFKSINDTHGHAAGDAVIAEVAARLLEVTREHDLCGRWGGDELLVVVAKCDVATLRRVGEALLEAVRARPVAMAEGGAIAVTTSIGAHLAGEDEPLDRGASRADAALYAAKRQGRDRMVVYDPDAHRHHAIAVMA